MARWGFRNRNPSPYRSGHHSGVRQPASGWATERIAEFKFIRWHGGAETIRQNSLFKDFCLLAEDPSRKRKYLYVVGMEHPLKFFNSGRALSSVLSQHPALQESLSSVYPDRFRKVREYYAFRKGEVVIQDISDWVTGLAWEAEADWLAAK